MAANIPRAASCTLLTCFAAVGLLWCRAGLESAGKWVGHHSVKLAAETGNLLCCRASASVHPAPAGHQGCSASTLLV